MSARTKTWLKTLLIVGIIVVPILAWVTYFHNALIASWLPQWEPLQHTVQKLGNAPADAGAAGDDDDPDTSGNEIPVHVAKIVTATLHRYVNGFGTVAPRPAQADAPAGAANVAPPVAGVVAQVLCRVGQAVHAGDTLVQLDDRLAKSAVDQAQAALDQAQASFTLLKAGPTANDLAIAQSNIDKAQAALDLAKKNEQRARQLAADGGAPQKNVEQAAQESAAAQDDLTAAQKQLAILKNTPRPEELTLESAKVAQAQAALASARLQEQMLAIRAPIDGTITSIDANAGEAVDSMRPLVQIVAMDRLMVDADIPATDLPAHAEGLDAQILVGRETPESDTPPVMGKVVSVSPSVDPKSGAVQVAINLAPDAALRPGLSVRVRIIAAEHKDVLAVPRQAVVTDENGDSVIALVENDQATHKQVKTGIEENGLVEIEAEGIKAGDTVVTAGAFGLPQATRVKVVE